MPIITTSIVVNFISKLKKSSRLSAEVDSRILGFNKGRTHFNAGESVGVLVRASDLVRQYPLAVTTSYGRASYIEVVSEVVTETITFLNSATSSVSKIPTGIINTLWFGNNLGDLSYSDSTIIASTHGVAIAEITYTTESLLYSIPSPATLGGRDYFNILVLVSGSDGTVV